MKRVASQHTSRPGAVIYTRVSTKEQVENLSLPTQQEACRAFCDREGLRVEEVFVDRGESAKTTDRAEFQRLLTYCRQHKGRVRFVVVYAINRFSRNTYDHVVITALLHKLGITLRSVTEPIDETSTGKLMEGILSAFAQFDNDVRSERTRTGMQAALKAGRWPFGVPLGYQRRLDGHGFSTIEPDPERADTVRRAFELIATGLHTKREVLRVVTDLGLRTLRGRYVSPQTFDKMLRNPLYCGRLAVEGWDLGEFEGLFEPVIDRPLFERAQAALDGRAVTVRPHARNHEDFPLRRFVRCAGCGTPVTGGWAQGRRARYARYWCRKAGCRAVKISKAELEGQFFDFLAHLRPRSEYLRLFRELVLKSWRDRQADAAATVQELRRRVDDLTQRRSRLEEAYVFDRKISDDTYGRQKEKLDEDIALAEIAAHDARIDEIDIEGLVGFAEHLLTNAGRLWQEFPLDQRQRLQSILFPKGVTYGNDGFEPVETSVIFDALRMLDVRKSRKASPTGFEPVLPT